MFRIFLREWSDHDLLREWSDHNFLLREWSWTTRAMLLNSLRGTPGRFGAQRWKRRWLILYFYGVEKGDDNEDKAHCDANWHIWFRLNIKDLHIVVQFTSSTFHSPMFYRGTSKNWCTSDVFLKKRKNIGSNQHVYVCRFSLYLRGRRWRRHRSWRRPRRTWPWRPPSSGLSFYLHI